MHRRWKALDINEFLQNRDLSTYTNEPFSKKVEKPWGYEIIFTPPTLSYAGKIIHVQAGKRLSLQVHDKKQESYFIASGRGGVMLENTKGEMEEIELQKDQGLTVAIGQKHRLFGITDCDIFEVSTPEIGTTFRLEDDYNRPDETEEMREEERK